VGGTDPAQSAGKIFFGRAPPLFGSKSTISRFSDRFRDGQYSLVSFLFVVLLLTVPQCPAICKSGGARAPVTHGVGATDYVIQRSMHRCSRRTAVNTKMRCVRDKHLDVYQSLHGGANSIINI